MRIVITGQPVLSAVTLRPCFERRGRGFALSRPDSPNLKALPVHETCTSFPGPWTGPETVFHRLVLQTHFSILPGAV